MKLPGLPPPQGVVKTLRAAPQRATFASAQAERISVAETGTEEPSGVGESKSRPNPQAGGLARLRKAASKLSETPSTAADHSNEAFGSLFQQVEQKLAAVAADEAPSQSPHNDAAPAPRGAGLKAAESLQLLQKPQQAAASEGGEARSNVVQLSNFLTVAGGAAKNLRSISTAASTTGDPSATELGAAPPADAVTQEGTALSAKPVVAGDASGAASDQEAKGDDFNSGPAPKTTPLSPAADLASPALQSAPSPASPTQQIAENIRGAFAAAGVTQAKLPAQAPLKTLEIQLSPEGLGQVSVKLRAEQGRLKVDISAKNPATQDLLAADAQNLLASLKTADGPLREVDVSFSQSHQGPAPDAHGQSFSQPQNNPAEAQAGFTTKEGRDSDQRQGQDQRSAPSPQAEAAPAHMRQRGVDRADGVYL